MEEKKKRVRPTWAMVRALEAQIKSLHAKLDDQIDGTSMLVQDCDGWRDKYHALLAERDFYKSAADALVAKNKELGDNIEISYPKIEFNAADGEYIRNFLDELGPLTSEDNDAKSEPVVVKRGFWSRLFKR